MTGFSSNKFSQKILDIFSEEQLNDLAFQTGFHKRKNRAKVLGSSFLMMCLYVCKQVTLYSLDNILHFLSKERDTHLIKQGLSERFNEAGMNYLKAIFENLYIHLYSSCLDNLNHFSSIRVLDATSFALPAQFASVYEGYGGDGTASVLGIQQEIDLLGKQFYAPSP